MREKQFQTYISQAVVFLAFLAFAMVYGSVADLPFSMHIYNGTEYAAGQFYAAFGELPAFICFSGAAAMVFVRRNRVHKSWSRLLGIVCALVFFAGLALAIHEATDNVPQLPKWVAVFICTFAICGASFLMVNYTKRFHSRKIFRYAIVIFLTALLTLLIVNTIKVPWGRVRMHFIYQTKNKDLFSPWWVFGNPAKDALIAQGIPKGEFRSCPSGHAACAACMFLLIFFPMRKQNTFALWVRFFIGFLWSALVSYSRIKMGAHFITDVVISNVIFTLCTMLVGYFFGYRNRFFNAIWFYLNDHPNPLSKRNRDKKIS